MAADTEIVVNATHHHLHLVGTVVNLYVTALVVLNFGNRQKRLGRVAGDFGVQMLSNNA